MQITTVNVLVGPLADLDLKLFYFKYFSDRKWDKMTNCDRTSCGCFEMKALKV